MNARDRRRAAFFFNRPQPQSYAPFLSPPPPPPPVPGATCGTAAPEVNGVTFGSTSSASASQWWKVTLVNGSYEIANTGIDGTIQTAQFFVGPNCAGLGPGNPISLPGPTPVIVTNGVLFIQVAVNATPTAYTLKVS